MSITLRDRLIKKIAEVKFDTLSVFSILYAAHLLFDQLAKPAELAFWHHGLPMAIERGSVIVLALAALMRPQSLLLLLAMMLSCVIDYLTHMPVASNNFTLSAFAAVAVLLSALYLLIADHALDRGRLSATMAPLMRDLLVILYFYGVLHKINGDFLNPTVSCSVALYKPLTSPLGLQDWWLGHYAAIYLTFIVESLAIVLLLSRRWKFWALAVGIPFHLLIGFSGYAFYMDFSLVCLALYVPFLPLEYFERLNQAWQRLSLRTRTLLMALPAPLFLVTLLAGRIHLPGLGWPVHAMPLFALIGIGFYLSVLRLCPVNTVCTTAMRYRYPALALLSLLFLLNGLSPYVGFKTESSIAMFSNLRTEGGSTNHLLITRPPYLFSYQRNLVTILSSSAPELRQYIGPNRQMVEYELHRFLAGAPDTQVQFVKDGVSYDHVDPADNLYLATGTLLRQLLVFKPVDWTEPKPCTH